MADDTKEVEEYIHSFLEAIENGITDKYDLPTEVEFEIATIKTKSIGGGFKIIVADAKGKYKNQNISKTKFKIPRKKSGKFSAGKWDNFHGIKV